MRAPAPNFAHLVSLTDAYGTFEHADLAKVRRDHGYCTDDVARVLLVASRETDTSPLVEALEDGALRFLMEAQAGDGRCLNRRTSEGVWWGGASVEDCWGRALWAFGTAAHRSSQPDVRAQAVTCFERGIARRSPWRRSSAFAALGAVEMLADDPDHRATRTFLTAAARVVGTRDAASRWRWPEPRLRYANAVLPDALIAAGVALGRDDFLAEGLALLEWLLEGETRGGHLSVTPAGGRGPRDEGPGFDQQPIEVAALADACARAAAVTGEPVWDLALESCVQWFLGDNDAKTPMYDPETGGGYDGLREDGPNLNQGAESTLALLSTLQLAQRSQVASCP